MTIKLLDCTLRDGGYVNDWNFGEKQIVDIAGKISRSKADIVELGFLKNEPYQRDRAVFSDVSQLIPLIPKDRKGVMYAAMVEVLNPIPLDMLAPYDGSSIDTIRVIVWKRLLNEGFEYCRGIVEKGYKLCVQPARTEQYSFEEYTQLIELFSSINPYAIYVVDSWGTMNNAQLADYFEIADKNLKPEVALGYHGHNNLLQTFGVAQALLSYNFDRKIILDASVYGIGRGAGNLNIEIIASYLNEAHGKKYAIKPFLDVYQEYLKDIYAKERWGYSMGLYLTAIHHCNPEYANYYARLGVQESVLADVFDSISEDDKIIFSREKADRCLASVVGSKGIE